MKLYTNVERIFNELEEIGKSTSDSLDIKDLTQFDNFITMELMQLTFV